jgi:imidazolonepropionase-like amidohydrolase
MENEIMRLVSKMLAASFLASASPLLAEQPSTLIKDVSVFDGEKLVGKRSVLISGDKITNPDFRGKPANATVIIDGKGKMLMPGMIDAHVHAMQGLDTALLFGVTTQLDMFTAPEMNKEVKDKTKNGGNTGVSDLYSAGYLATVPKGHGSQFGVKVPTLTTPGEADAWVAARVAEGSDYIKIVNESGETVGRPMPTLDAPTTAALIAAAHRYKKLAVVHVQTQALAENAIQSGADGLVHLFFDKAGGQEFAALAKQKGAFVTPTLTVFEGYSGRSGTATLLGSPAFKELLSKDAIETIRAQFGADRTASIDANVKNTISALAKVGVPILAGTDAGNPATWYGISMHRELELLVAAGLSPSQALQAATSAPAKAYRLADRGRIAKGMKADLLLVEGDPSRDITATRNIVEVWKNGMPASKLREERRIAVRAEASGKAPDAVALPADGRILALTSDNGKVVMKAPLGSWMESTDSMMGGQSTVKLAVNGKAPDGQPALVMTGDVTKGTFGQWAGVSFMPGANFSAVNLSSANALKLWVRGEGAGFGVMGFSKAGGQMPSTAPMKVSTEWTELTIPFAAMPKFDASGALMFAITALQPGPYRLEIADVRLVMEPKP